MSQHLPPFESLWLNYPLGTVPQVKQAIGGAVDDTAGGKPWILNTCTIRMSRAFNYSGQPVPGPGVAKSYGMLVIRGDHKWYALRVAEFGKYMLAKYGKPTVSVANPTSIPDEMTTKRGVIQFVIHFSDATGHFDLWDGETCRYETFFGTSYPIQKVNLWAC